VRNKGAFLPLVAIFVFTGAFVDAVAAAKKPPRQWLTLPNCQFMPQEYRDGDSFHVMTSDQRQFVFRLYFVDAPETDVSIKERVREQAAYFGVSEEEVLKAGESAKKVAAEWLKQTCAVTTRWQSAQGRGRLPRYYAQIEVGGRDLGELLVTYGWARAKGTVAILPDGKPAKEHMAKLAKLEAAAKAKRIGIWAMSKNAGQ
jgi:endonuclease YncB( thermonuclease family)